MTDLNDGKSPQVDTSLPVFGGAMKEQFASHPRRWEGLEYVYAVISRRSKGLSIGVNLNIDKACNFDCVYCCVDRSVAPVRRDVDMEQVERELDVMLEAVANGEIWGHPKFAGLDERYRRVNDIAFSGDGEPTAYAGFESACAVAVRMKKKHGLHDVKIMVITNATLFDRERVRRGLELLDQNGGEIWAKLDAGTELYYQQIDRTKVPLKKVLENIAWCGVVRPIVIQSLFMAIHGESLKDAEFEAYLDRLDELVNQGCQIKLVQLYTTARWTAEPYVSSLSNDHLDRLGARLAERLPGLAYEVYYGVD